MGSIKPTAAYVRTHRSPKDLSSNPPEFIGQVTEEGRAIWSLLSTPQTVETLRRTIRHDADRVVSEDTVVAVLEELVKRDLAELSPDS